VNGAIDAIRLEGVRRDFGERPALGQVSLCLGAGEALLVIGPNGAGKTTLLRILATLLRPSGGRATVLGSELPREAWKLRGRVGYLGHEPLLYRELTGRENLRFHARLHGIADEQAAARIDERVDQLSVGMRQRLALCRCLLHDPELLLLDEPEAHLDVEGRELIRAALAERPGATRVVVTHDPERALSQADRVLVLGHGGVPLRECAASELAAGEALAAVAGVPG
jgi:heme exporter protein A